MLSTELTTNSLDTFSAGKIDLKFFCSVAPTAAGFAQPAIELRLTIVSPEPRDTSLAKASRLASMKIWAALVPVAVSAQLEVPLLMPKVCVPNVPFSVAATTWIRPFLSPKANEPRPQPAVPYGSAFATPPTRSTHEQIPKHTLRIWLLPCR